MNNKAKRIAKAYRKVNRLIVAGKCNAEIKHIINNDVSLAVLMDGRTIQGERRHLQHVIKRGAYNY